MQNCAKTTPDSTIFKSCHTIRTTHTQHIPRILLYGFVAKSLARGCWAFLTTCASQKVLFPISSMAQWRALCDVVWLLRQWEKIYIFIGTIWVKLNCVIWDYQFSQGRTIIFTLTHRVYGVCVCDYVRLRLHRYERVPTSMCRNMGFWPYINTQRRPYHNPFEASQQQKNRATKPNKYIYR